MRTLVHLGLILNKCSSHLWLNTAMSMHQKKSKQILISINFIIHAELLIVWAACRCYDSDTNIQYIATTLLEVRLKLHTYTMGPSTIRECDPRFQHSIEWMTDREGVHHICGILVRLQQKPLLMPSLWGPLFSSGL